VLLFHANEAGGVEGRFELAHDLLEIDGRVPKLFRECV
jgi:hypothetical protein